MRLLGKKIRRLLKRNSFHFAVQIKNRMSEIVSILQYKSQFVFWFYQNRSIGEYFLPWNPNLSVTILNIETDSLFLESMIKVSICGYSINRLNYVVCIVENCKTWQCILAKTKASMFTWMVFFYFLHDLIININTLWFLLFYFLHVIFLSVFV